MAMTSGVWLRSCLYRNEPPVLEQRAFLRRIILLRRLGFPLRPSSGDQFPVLYLGVLARFLFVLIWSGVKYYDSLGVLRSLRHAC